MKKKLNKVKNNNYAISAVVLTIGLCVGYLAATVMQPKQASAQEIERAKSEITKLYQGKTVAACWEVNKGAELAAGKYELTYRNLRINKHADRAIITDCSDVDTLLAKNKAGQWVLTNVNLQIGNRVSPAWQKECGIEDITVADDKIRSENRSIDEMNLHECRQIKQD